MQPHAQTLQNAVDHHRAGDLHRAESLYREILRLDPEHGEALHLLGVAAHQRKRSREAVDLISRSIAAGHSSALHYSNLGTAYRELGKSKEAIASFREAIRLDPEFAGAHYNLAIALADEKQLDNAIESFREAVRVDPQFIDAHNNLGAALSRQGRYTEAVDSLRIAATLVPMRADIHYNLGNALAASGQANAAAAAFREATRLAPEFAEAYNNLGTVLKQLGQLSEAAGCLEKALELKPQYGEAIYNLAAVHRAQGDAVGAQKLYQQATGLNEDAGFHYRIGVSLQEQGRYREATEQYRRALQIEPNRADALFRLGYICMSEGRHDEAREFYEQVLWIEPNHMQALTNLGSVLVSLERADEAAECFRQVASLQPENAAAHYNLGNACKDSWRLDEAEACYRRALELDPQLAEAHINLGVVLERQGQPDQSIACHSRALEICPDDAAAHFHRALARLLVGDLERGWAEYEWRFQYEGKHRDFAQPAWDGSPLDGRNLLIRAEQGVGDAIMFASCFPDVIAQTGHCLIECDTRLVPLLARSFPLAHVAAAPVETLEQVRHVLSQMQLHIAAGSLPRFVRPRLSAFPQSRRYLAPDAARLAKWQWRLGALGEGLKVGISWRGGAKPHIRRRRSTPLVEWQPIFAIPNVQFINLQYGTCTDELAEIEQSLGARVHDWDDADPLAELDDFAAQIAALDLVISVDNSTVHLAGALGAAVWTLLPFAPNWRWMLHRDDTPWYPTMRLFRQTESNSWTAVIERVASSLHEAAQFASRGDAAASRAESQSGRDATRERKKYEKIWAHDVYREVSFAVKDAENVGLVDRLRQYDVRTVLDAGCGAGKLMQKLMTDHGDEFAVHGIDISANCLDPFFNDIRDDVLTVGCLWDSKLFSKAYDAVVCTDVLEHIPTKHVPKVLENFHRCTRKLCYLAIALFPDRLGPELLDEPLHLTVRRPNWWYARLALAGLTVAAHAVEKDAAGRDLWLHVFATPQR